MTACRLIFDSPASGAWNMALDEALLESAALRGLPTLRFYAWEEPTLSLGYFQSHHECAEHTASLACPFVRRASGGGAIVHDQELTYSLAIPARRHQAGRIEALYDAVHLALIRSLSEMGVSAGLCETALANQENKLGGKAKEPFLCFERRARGDVLFGETKIGGSAQRRRGGAALLHGSLLLAKSKAAPELLGLCELTHDDRWRLGGDLAGRLTTRWVEFVLEKLDLSGKAGTIFPEESDRAKTFLAEKYGASDWICRR